MSNNFQEFEFMLPTVIKSGKGICGEIPNELRLRNKLKPMLITDKGLVKAGLADKIIQYLKMAGYDDIVIFDQVEPNPRDVTVAKAGEIGKINNVDCLIALGGGSSIDTAKGAGILMTAGGKVKDYEGLGKVPGKITTLFAIPTTVGTGSEVTFWAVIKDTAENYKLSIGSPFIAPEIAFVDPGFVEKLPPAIIAATGMDALTHAIEGYTSKVAGPITDACAIYAIELISKNIREAVYGDSSEAKGNLLIGSLIAGICFGNSDVGGAHCMGEALGGLYDTPHGESCAVSLPYIMEFNFVSDLQKYANIANALGVNVRMLSLRQAAYASVEEIRKLNEDLNIPNLRKVGAKIDDLEELAMRSATNVSVEDNSRFITIDDFRDLFAKAFSD